MLEGDSRKEDSWACRRMGGEEVEVASVMGVLRTGWEEGGGYMLVVVK